MQRFSPKFIMIDLDGTLVDSVPDLTKSVDEMMLKIGGKPYGEKKVRNWVGNGVQKLVARALMNKLEGEVDKDLYNKAYPIFLELYKKNNAKKSRLYDGVLEALDFIKNNNFKLGCVTNKAEAFTIPLLKELKIFDKFEIIISGDTLERKKPDPLPLTHAAEFFNENPKDGLLIGDSISDIKAARAAGFKVICMSYGYNHGIDIRTQNPDAVIDSMIKIKNFVTT